MRDLKAFLEESNKIEGITRPVTDAELEAAGKFLVLDPLSVEDVERIIGVFQPGAVLRDRAGLDVRVGNHFPPRGCPGIRSGLANILSDADQYSGLEKAHDIHCQYETLHPFTDGNGRSGRMIWLWMRKGRAPLGFLHQFYYSSLDNYRG